MLQWKVHGTTGLPGMETFIVVLVPNNVLISDTIHRKALHRSGKDHCILLVLSSGIYHYKFIVDGEWKFIPELPHMNDFTGRTTNILQVTVSAPSQIHDCSIEKSFTYFLRSCWICGARNMFLRIQRAFLNLKLLHHQNLATGGYFRQMMTLLRNLLPYPLSFLSYYQVRRTWSWTRHPGKNIMQSSTISSLKRGGLHSHLSLLILPTDSIPSM